MKLMCSRRVVLGCFAALVSGGPVLAQPDFYRGKQISLIVPSGPGGGYDLYSRFLSRHIPKHIPGNPVVVVKNMPGAGGIAAANHLYQIAAPDGLTIGIVQNTITLNQLAKQSSVQYDVRKFSWLGNMSVSSAICALSGPAKDASTKDLFEKEVLVGASTGATNLIPTLLNNLGMTRFKIVRGYPASNAVLLAMEKGEVNGICGWSWDGARVNARDLLGRGVIKVALDVAIQPQAELKAMGVPFIMEHVPAGENKEVLKVILSTQLYNRPFVAPPGVPADRLKLLRDALAATMKDPEAIAEAEKMGIDLEYLSPEQISDVIQVALGAPARIQERAADELSKAGFGG